jgi:hypothetical protein
MASASDKRAGKPTDSVLSKPVGTAIFVSAMAVLWLIVSVLAYYLLQPAEPVEQARAPLERPSAVERLFHHNR